MTPAAGAAIVWWCIRLSGAIALVFFCIGGHLPRNCLGGIRFSYTLADDEVWRKVHHRYRWGMLILGLLCLLFPVTSLAQLLLLTIIITVALIAWVGVAYADAKQIYRGFGVTPTQ